MTKPEDKAYRWAGRPTTSKDEFDAIIRTHIRYEDWDLTAFRSGAVLTDWELDAAEAGIVDPELRPFLMRQALIGVWRIAKWNAMECSTKEWPTKGADGKIIAHRCMHLIRPQSVPTAGHELSPVHTYVIDVRWGEASVMGGLRRVDAAIKHWLATHVNYALRVYYLFVQSGQVKDARDAANVMSRRLQWEVNKTNMHRRGEGPAARAPVFVVSQLGDLWRATKPFIDSFTNTGNSRVVSASKRADLQRKFPLFLSEMPKIAPNNPIALNALACPGDVVRYEELYIYKDVADIQQEREAYFLVHMGRDNYGTAALLEAHMSVWPPPNWWVDRWEICAYFPYTALGDKLRGRGILYTEGEVAKLMTHATENWYEDEWLGEIK